MSWLRIDATFRDNAKVLRAARLTGQGKLAVMGFLVSLWGWCIETAPDGMIRAEDFEDIAQNLGWPGDCATLADSLLASGKNGGDGLLERRGDDLQIHDWDSWAGTYIRERDAARERMRTLRENKRTLRERSANVTVTLPVKKEEGRSNINTPSASQGAAVGALAAGAEPVEHEPQVAGECYLSKRKRKLSGDALRRFEEFWRAFGYPKGKAEAADAWLDLKPDGATFAAILVGAKREAERRPGLIAKNRTPKWAQGWLAARRWEDEPDGDAEAPGAIEGFTPRAPTPEELAGLAAAGEGEFFQ